MTMRFLLALMLVPLSACTLPGMKINPETSSNEYGIKLHLISGPFLSEQHRYANFFHDSTGVKSLQSIAQLSEDYIYTVGPRDSLSIVVWQHPELTNPTGNADAANGRIVRADGTIFFPFVGVVRVSGLTVEEVRRLVAEKLSPYIKSPQVDVSVLGYRSRRIHVTGEVNNPGIQYLTNEPPRLMNAVNQAGGLSQLADRRTAVLHRGGQRYEINLLELYAQGGMGQNLVLQDGDNLHISDNRYNQVFVLGEVTRQASVEMYKGRLTLAEVLSSDKIGGINFSSADTSSIYVIRGIRSVLPVPAADSNLTSEQAVMFSEEDRVPQMAENGEVMEFVQPHVFHLDAASPEALLLADRFELMPRDVVFVSTLGIARWNRVIQQMAPTLQSIFQVRALQNAF
jgi:polysaccharide export outer membrane protein